MALTSSDREYARYHREIAERHSIPRDVAHIGLHDLSPMPSPPLAPAILTPQPEYNARNLPGDSAARKNIPMCSGLLDYFPDALAEIAHVSYLGNEKHNPGEPMHHARGKSMDHADCIIRHLTERGSRDPAGIRHSAQMAWRALALLQEELERDLGLPLPRGAR